MKKTSIMVALVAAMAIGSTAHARGGFGPGMGPAGWGGNGCGPCAEVTPEQTAAYKKQLANILPLKEEMLQKRMKLQKEWVKETPDNEKMTKLQAELREIRGKYFKAREEAGFDSGRGYYKNRGYHKRGHGQRGCGDAMRGYGCAPCADQDSIDR